MVIVVCCCTRVRLVRCTRVRLVVVVVVVVVVIILVVVVAVVVVGVVVVGVAVAVVVVDGCLIIERDAALYCSNIFCLPNCCTPCAYLKKCTLPAQTLIFLKSGCSARGLDNFLNTFIPIEN
ncbi:unnamed protein product [Polarella glacialis]|uniref:Uncharacterized protein n=1 Tax=Polarella glacialis TaxID=89957 RepID=A0A813JQK9_POLGL|nr:unnamed protein product [Polarella glacialis]